MARLKAIVVLLVIPLLFAGAPGPVAADSGSNSQVWQDGELVSRKTIFPRPHHPRTTYVYRIKSGAVHYVARFDRPLSLRLYAPLKFSIDRGHLYVKDADGTELKASNVRRSEPAIRR